MRGSIQKKPNGYSVVVDAGRDHRGKRKQIRRSGFRTRKEAEKKLTELLSQIHEGKQIYSTKVSVVDLLKKYDDVHLSHLKEATQKGYRSGYQRFLKYLKEDQLESIKPYHIQEAYHEMAKHYSAYSYNQTYTVMKDFFNFALENEFIKTNPHKVKMMKKPKSEIEIWSREEMYAFLNVCKFQLVFYTMFYLTLHTGMRMGEIRGLKWSDIDMKGKEIRVTAALGKDDHSFNSRKETKTQSSNRVIPITDKTVEVLRDFKKRAWVANTENGVFTTKYGKSPSPSFIGSKMKRFAEAAGVKPIRFHDMRHTHATILIQEGVNVKIVSERLGHSDVATTLNIYTHFDDETRREAAEIFDNVTELVIDTTKKSL